MSLVGTLVSWVRETLDRAPGGGGPEHGDEHLAAAALLVHVARVDGRVSAEETAALVGLLGSGFGLALADAEALVRRADRLDLDVDDVGTLVEMLGHEHGLDRSGFLTMAFRVAGADGRLGEFEDDLLWRVGHLLDLDDDAIEAARTGRLAAPAA